MITVQTGFGYYRGKLTGQIVCKACLPAGDHELPDDYEYVEVADQKELDLITVYTDPAESLKRQQETLVQERIRQTAIFALIIEGKLPAGYK